MRIVHVTNYGNPAPGSFVRGLCALSRAAHALGHDFTVVTAHIPGVTWSNDLFGSHARVFFVRTAWEAAATVRMLKPDIIHTHFVKFDLGVTLLNAVSGARIYWHMHTVRTSNTPAARVKAFIRNRIIGKRVTSLIAVSQSIADQLVHWYTPPSKITVVPNGVDAAWFRPPSVQERNASRARLGATPDERLALFFDRIDLKGGAVLKAAIPSAAALRLLVVAPKSRAANFADFPDAIVLDQQPDPRWLYWASDVLLFPSAAEGMPFVLLEGLATGLPAICSDIEPVREVARHVEGIATFASGDASRLADALNHPQRPRNESQNDQVSRSFSVETWSERILALYGINAR